MMNVWETFHFIYKEQLYEWLCQNFWAYQLKQSVSPKLLWKMYLNCNDIPLRGRTIYVICWVFFHFSVAFLLALMCVGTLFGEPWTSVFSEQGYVLLPISTWWLQLWVGGDIVWFSQFVLKCISCFCVIFKFPCPLISRWKKAVHLSNYVCYTMYLRMVIAHFVKSWEKKRLRVDK